MPIETTRMSTARPVLPFLNGDAPLGRQTGRELDRHRDTSTRATNHTHARLSVRSLSNGSRPDDPARLRRAEPTAPQHATYRANRREDPVGRRPQRPTVKARV